MAEQSSSFGKPVSESFWSGGAMASAENSPVTSESQSGDVGNPSASMIGSYVKIYGLPRTCTNLVTHLIRQNFHARVFANQLGWKHGPNLWREGDQIAGCPLKFVICVRHPYSWLVSFYRFETEGHGLTTDFSAFVRGNCNTYQNRNPIDRYNLLVRMWLGLAVSPECAQVVRAESIQADQIATLQTLERQLSFRRRHSQLQDERHQVGPDEQIRRRNFDADYYQSQRFLAHYDPRLLSFVNERIDQDLMNTLQYRILDQLPKPSLPESP